MASREILEARGDVGDASCARILQRAAAKRRETGRKYGTCVQQIGIFYDPFP